MNELRHAIRALFKRPGFTIVAVLTLALGIGANTAIFSVVNGVLLRALPYSEPNRIVDLSERGPKNISRVSHKNFVDWRQRATSFEAMSAYGCWTNAVRGGSEPRFAEVCQVSDGFFSVFGVSPARGRTFVAEETRAGGVAAAVVSDRFWKRTLSSNADLSSLHLDLDGRTARVVGVMPPQFDFPGATDATDVWVPSEIEPV